MIDNWKIVGPLFGNELNGNEKNKTSGRRSNLFQQKQVAYFVYFYKRQRVITFLLNNTIFLTPWSHFGLLYKITTESTSMIQVPVQSN